jgi:hypothetical protein
MAQIPPVFHKKCKYKAGLEKRQMKGAGPLSNKRFIFGALKQFTSSAIRDSMMYQESAGGGALAWKISMLNIAAGRKHQGPLSFLYMGLWAAPCSLTI